jgi:hypothetical protein
LEKRKGGQILVVRHGRRDQAVVIEALALRFPSGLGLRPIVRAPPIFFRIKKKDQYEEERERAEDKFQEAPGPKEAANLSPECVS